MKVDSGGQGELKRADDGFQEAAHLVSRRGKVGRDPVIDVMDMTAFIRLAVEARLLGVHVLRSVRPCKRCRLIVWEVALQD